MSFMMRESCGLLSLRAPSAGTSLLSVGVVVPDRLVMDRVDWCQSPSVVLPELRIFSDTGVTVGLSGGCGGLPPVPQGPKKLEDPERKSGELPE
jgi:hypothetical protein